MADGICAYYAVDRFNTVIIMSNDSDIVEILIVMCGYELYELTQ